MRFQTMLFFVCMICAFAMLYTYAKRGLYQSDRKKFPLSLSDVNMARETKKEAYRLIACMAPRSRLGWGSYYMRCKQLEILGKTYFKDIKVEPLDYARALHVKKQYDAAIFIKSTPRLKWWPKLWKSFQKIYVDVIDAKKGGIDFKHLKAKSPRATLIVQNVYQQRLYKASFNTIIIEHMPSSLNHSDWVSTSSLSHPIRAISPMLRQSDSICENINTSLVILRS